MFDNKFLITLIGLAVAVAAICNYKPSGTKTRENFLGNLPSMKAKVMTQVETSNGAQSLPMNSTLIGTNGYKKGDMYQTAGTYQSALSPRFSNQSYGANIRYNPPSYENMAVPNNPLGLSKMARENYGCVSGNCGSGCKPGDASNVNGYNPVLGDQAGFTNGNYSEVAASAGYGKYSPRDSEYPDTLSMIPVGDMTTINSAGETENPIIYDRLIFANRNSNLRSRGCHLRGDLPIVPSYGEWMRPSVQPQIDLQEGALNVMGGFDNDTNRALTQLMFQSSAGTDQTLGGINLNNTNVASQFATSIGPMSDISVSAYP